MDSWILFAIIAAIALVAGILSIPRSHKVPFSEPSPERKVTANPEFFIDHGTRKIQKQMAFTDARLAQEDQIAHADRRQQERVATEKVLHDALITQTTAATKLTEIALKKEMDVPTLNLTRLEQEKVKTDVDRAKQLSTLKVRENWELEQVRIAAYEGEVQIDMQAALGMHMMDVEKLDYISGKIALLKSQNADPERIETLVTIREQMARRLLQAGDGKELEGADEAPQGGEGN